MALHILNTSIAKSEFQPLQIWVHQDPNQAYLVGNSISIGLKRLWIIAADWGCQLTVYSHFRWWPAKLPYLHAQLVLRSKPLDCSMRRGSLADGGDAMTRVVAGVGGFIPDRAVLNSVCFWVCDPGPDGAGVLRSRLIISWWDLIPYLIGNLCGCG